MSLGENIRRFRSQMGISQDALAEKLGVARQSISKWERDAATPELEKLAAMSELFGVTLDELVKNENTAGEPRGHEEPAPHGAVPKTRFIVGVVLLCAGIFISVLLMLRYNVLLSALLLCSPLLAGGLICMFVRRRAWFWVLVSIYAPVLLYLKFGTGVYIREALLLFRGADWVNPARGALAVCMVLADLGVGAAGVIAFRDARVSQSWVHAAVFLLLGLLFLVPASVIVGWDSVYLYRIVYGAKHLLFAAIIIYASVLMRSVRSDK